MIPIQLISDCGDGNALARVLAQVKCQVHEAAFLPAIHVSSDLESSGNLVDMVGVLQEQSSIVLLNCAPRNGEAKCWGNGSPFARLTVGKTQVFGTVGGLCFSLLQKALGKPLSLQLFNLDRETLLKLDVPKHRHEHIVGSQFRSLEFLPLLAGFFHRHINGLPNTPFTNVPESPQAAWWVDNFGNVKLTTLPEEVDFEPGMTVSVRIRDLTHQIRCYDGLRSVPEGEPGLVVGSSGMWVGEQDCRFLELQINGGSFAKGYNIRSGDEVEVSVD